MRESKSCSLVKLTIWLSILIAFDHFLFSRNGCSAKSKTFFTALHSVEFADVHTGLQIGLPRMRYLWNRMARILTHHRVVWRLWEDPVPDTHSSPSGTSNDDSVLLIRAIKQKIHFLVETFCWSNWAVQLRALFWSGKNSLKNMFFYHKNLRSGPLNHPLTGLSQVESERNLKLGRLQSRQCGLKVN